ncbi:type VI secretion system accessory protein TagJ [Vibrio atypicus]|uniref:type VI secretion system accessory protein TagJ n=1 Tax=Vibrio atypicus TaxID=558271 RepID=UPI003735308C
MQQQLKNLLQEGRLTKAIELCGDKLKDSPADFELRSLFIEMLCVDGQLERADQQLNLIVKQFPECLPGAMNMRQLVHAAQARVDFGVGGDTATYVGNGKHTLAPLIKLRMALRDENSEQLTDAAFKLEESRESRTVTINDMSVETLRDIDDSLAGYLEVFGTNGKYYLIPYSDICWLKFMPVESLFESVWRKAEIDILNGPSGEVFIPLTYLQSESDCEKLGRETDWQQMLDSDFYQGRGLKLWLVNDSAFSITSLQVLEVSPETELVE